jgi:hypothetical protein
MGKKMSTPGMQSRRIKESWQQTGCHRLRNGFHLQKVAEILIYRTNILCQADTVYTPERMIA